MPDTLTKLTALAQAAIGALPIPAGSPKWVAAFEAALARAHTAAAMVAIAERTGVPPKGLSRAERSDIKAQVAEQLRYLKGFITALPGMSEAQIAARAKLYAGALKPTYYATRWGAWDIPDGLLPGRQSCVGNCKCEISVADNGDGTGTLTRTAHAEHHCTECPPLAGDHPVRRRGYAEVKQSAQERAMFANMGRSKGGGGFGPGGKPTGGQGGLYPKGPDGKREGPSNDAGAQGAPKTTPAAAHAAPKQSLDQSLKDAERQIHKQRYETAHAFDPDGNPLFTNDGGKDYVEISDAALQKMTNKDVTFTHNHPAGWDFPPSDPRHNGNSFSWEDLDVAMSVNAKEMRAITPTRVYSIKRPAAGWNATATRSAYQAANSKTRATFSEAIRTNRMTIAEAEAQHIHKVWSEVSTQIGAAYGYEDYHD